MPGKAAGGEPGPAAGGGTGPAAGRPPVRAEASGGVLEITLDRPPANAIDAATSRAL
jgi:hypothetical protein